MTSIDQTQRFLNAAEAGDQAEIRRAAISGAEMDAIDEQGRTALQIASEQGDHATMRTILAARDVRRMMDLGVAPDTHREERISA